MASAKSGKTVRLPSLKSVPPSMYSFQSPSIKIPGRNSPKASWEETMNDLSRGLQQICGSPPGAGSMSPLTLTTPLPSPVATTATLTSAFGCFTDSPPPVMTPPRRVLLRELRRADSVHGCGTRRNQRPIFVRHIETHAELQNRLSEICGTGSTPEGQPDPEAKTPDVVHKMAVYSPGKGVHRNAVHARVNTSPYSVEELIVRVRNRRTMSIETISGSGRVLDQFTLSNEALVQQLIGHLADDKCLVIRERPTSMLASTFTATGSRFVPIVKHDESKMELTVVIHVPSEFRFEDLTVKTVDDRVVIVGKKRALSMPQSLTSNFRLVGTLFPFFRVVIQLPVGTDSRSVSACLTRHQQLIIRGKLGPVLRRNTF